MLVKRQTENSFWLRRTCQSRKRKGQRSSIMADVVLTNIDPKRRGSLDDLVPMERRCSPCFLCGTNCLICQRGETSPWKGQNPTGMTPANALVETPKTGHFSFCQHPACSSLSSSGSEDSSVVSIPRIYFCSEPCRLIHQDEGKSNSNLKDSQGPSEGQKNPECSLSPSVEKPICCVAFAVAENSTVGRFMVASKEVRPLETVLEDLPVVIAPQSQPVCLVCLRKARNLEFPCLQCGFPTCSKECVPSHQNLPECAILSQKPGSALKCEDDLNQSSIAYASVGVIRFLDFIAESNDPKHTLNNDNNGTAKNPTHRRDWLLRLMDHIPDIKVDPSHCQYLEEIVQFLSGVFSPQRVERAYGILRVNSFGFTTSQGGEGRALYPLVALMSHSCQPNVQHVQSGSDGRVKLVAQRLIKPGEEMTISYINTFQGPLERRQTLKEQWFFDCSCARCKDMSDGGLFSHAVLCQKCFDRVLPQDQLNPITTWICQGCQFQYPANYAKDREVEVAKEWENESMDRANIKQCEDFIKKVESQSLPKFNHFLIKIKSHLAVLYTVRESDETLINRPILERRIELCQSIIKYLYHVDNGQTKKLGVFLLEMNRPKMRLAKLNFDEGISSRKEYLKMLAEGARTETQAKNMIGRYRLVNSFAIKSEACKFEHQ